MALSVTAYSKSALLSAIEKLLAQRSLKESPTLLKRAISRIKSKPQLDAIHSVAVSHGAKFIVIEDSYVDKHFLEDFAGYYSRCYARYGRRCVRIHFVKGEFADTSEFTNLLHRKPADEINHRVGYIGYMVVKPLPQSVIGRTALPPTDNHNVEYTALKSFDTQIGGHKFSVKCALFQEQDHEIAACATVAIWSILSATSAMFDNQVLSPYQITRMAGENNSFKNRIIPNDGLTQIQVLSMLKKAGLDYFYFEYDAFRHVIDADILDYFFSSNEGRKSKTLPQGTPKDAVSSLDSYAESQMQLSGRVLYAFLRGGFPCIVTAFIPAKDQNEIDFDAHAVAAVGYKVAEEGIYTGTAGGEESALRFTADRLSHIYCVDDNHAPYTPYRFGPRGKIENLDSEPFLIGNIIVPIYHKIRKNFPEAVQKAEHYNSLIEIILPSLKGKIEWDIFLCEIGKIKLKSETAMPILKTFNALYSGMRPDLCGPSPPCMVRKNSLTCF